MKRLLAVALMLGSPLLLSTFGASLGVVGCAGGGSGGSGGGANGAGGGSGGGTSSDRYTRVVADPNSTGDRTYLAMAVDPSQERVGIAYIVGSGFVDDTFNMLPDGGGVLADGGSTPNYEVRYVEWKDGVMGTPEKVETVKRFVGIDVAFQSSGEPVLTYLGGGSDMSAYWFQSDAIVNRRVAGTWTSQTVATRGNEATCGNKLSDFPAIVVGIWPQVLVDNAKTYLFWRDGHNGQFPQQDWAASDVEMASSTGGGWNYFCLEAGGNNKKGWGGHIRAAFGPNKQPGITYDLMLGGADTIGSSVFFQYQKADGTWAPALPVTTTGNTQTGASLAYDSQEGWGVAVLEKSNDSLGYTHSTNNGAVWSTLDPVVGSGSSGWYPSLAFDPMLHEPAIAYYFCSSQAAANESSCRPEEDELRITQLNSLSGMWNDEVVDVEGGAIPRLGFLPSGKRAVAYRARGTNIVKLAIEK